MDPITIILTALVTGAAAGLKPAAAEVVKAGYEGLKRLIKRKYMGVEVETLERDPSSEARKGLVKEGLEKTGAGQDEELLLQAQALLDAVWAHAPEAAAAVGVSIDELKAGSLQVRKIIAAGTGVSLRHADVVGDVVIEDVNAGRNDHSKA